MSVYIDNARNSFRGMRMAHMIADTLEELHAMADNIGLRREWFQGNASFPHYDVALTRRVAAIKAGAQAITSKELVGIIQKLRRTREYQ